MRISGDEDISRKGGPRQIEVPIGTWDQSDKGRPRHFGLSKHNPSIMENAFVRDCIVNNCAHRVSVQYDVCARTE
jgi:hypothetical protein